MHAALVQLASSTDPAVSRRDADAVLGTLDPADRLDLVVLPEAAQADFGAPDHDLAPGAEPLDGPFVALLATHARRLDATVVAGIFERHPEGGHPFNTLVAVGPDGGLEAAYRKVHLYDSFGYRESDRLTAAAVDPAPDLVVLPVGDRRVGLMTCYDLRFPELARMLVDAGADVLAVPSAWVRGPLKEDHWVTLLRARAIENTVDVLGVGQCGRGYVGRTCAIDPLGVVTAAIGSEPGVVRASCDADRLVRARETNPSLSNRRLGAVAGGGVP